MSSLSSYFVVVVAADIPVAVSFSLAAVAAVAAVAALASA